MPGCKPVLRFIHPAALLVLLAAAAGAWIVSADFGRLADDWFDLDRAFALHFAGGGGGFVGDADVCRLAQVFGYAIVLRDLVLGLGDLVVAARLGRGPADPRAED